MPRFSLAFCPRRALDGGMLDADRFRLRFGPYSTPRCRVGGCLTCSVRGRVKVVAISHTPIPWPLCKSSKHLTPIICGGLVRAVWRESNLGVAWNWGVSPQTVCKWRKALGVLPINEGTRELLRDWTPEVLNAAARERAREASRSPERAAKISAATKGKPKPPHIVQAMRRAATGRKTSAETRAKMSATHERMCAERRAAGEGWQDAWDDLLGKMSDKQLAERLGVHASTVFVRRKMLGVRSHRPHRPVTPARDWTVDEDRLLGTMPDTELAATLACTPVMVFNRRRSLRVVAFPGRQVNRTNP
jgi:hypothetical protein